MDRDPLTTIAESYALMATIQRLQVWMLGLTMIIVGLAVLVLGFTVWQHLVMRQEALVMHRLLLTNTQSIEAQTRALLERQRQP